MGDEASITDAPRLDASRAKIIARGAGFDLVGITTPDQARTSDAFSAWLDSGYAGEMTYLRRTASTRRDVRLADARARSVIVVGMHYGGREPSGPVARYARGEDYHDVMMDRLLALHQALEAQAGASIVARPYVDTGPILERDLASRAGLGWIGKNTNLISPRAGSFFFIGALLTDLELAPDPPFEADRCGTCTRCLEACPTGAFVEPRKLDATRCISYLTIELKGAIPTELREAIGPLLYGCDICQDVCPWNQRFASEVTEPRLRPRQGTPLRPEELLLQSDEEYRRRFAGSPMTRAKRRGLARNAAVVMGNRRDRRDVPSLVRALGDPEPLVREHVVWALRRIGGTEATAALEQHRATEKDEQVLRAFE